MCKDFIKKLRVPFWIISNNIDVILSIYYQKVLFHYQD